MKLRSVIGLKKHHKFYGKKVNEIIIKNKKMDLEDTKRDWCGQKFDVNGQQDSKPPRFTAKTYKTKEQMVAPEFDMIGSSID
jgi:hypothetical protein